MATYKYTQFGGNSVKDAYVKYNISPEFGTLIFPGDVITISGQAFARDMAIKSIALCAKWTSSAMGYKNVSIAKNKVGNFSLKVTVPEEAFDELNRRYGMLDESVSFELYPQNDMEYEETYYGCASINGYDDRAQTLSLCKYELAPQIIQMDFQRGADIDGLYKISNDGRTGICRDLKFSIDEQANANDITICTIDVIDTTNAETNQVSLNSEQIIGALTQSGLTEENTQASIKIILSGIDFNPIHSYRLEMKLGDEISITQRTDMIEISFANLHLSGASTGGVAMGMFSTATEGDPKFESAYPAHLYGGLGEETIKIIGNVIYPVGSVFFCTDEIQPVEVFGGTWEQIKDRFIVAAGNSYTEGSTGGSATSLFSATHKHLSPTGVSSKLLGVVNINGTQGGGKGNPFESVTSTYSGSSLSSNISLAYTANATVSGSVNTIPPYIAVCVWKRTGLYDVNADNTIATTMKSVRRLSYEQLEDK